MNLNVSRIFSLDSGLLFSRCSKTLLKSPGEPFAGDSHHIYTYIYMCVYADRCQVSPRLSVGMCPPCSLSVSCVLALHSSSPQKPPPPPLSTFSCRRLIADRWRFMCRRLSTFTFTAECAAAAAFRHASHTRVTVRRPSGFAPPGLEDTI